MQPFCSTTQQAARHARRLDSKGVAASAPYCARLGEAPVMAACVGRYSHAAISAPKKASGAVRMHVQAGSQAHAGERT